jgi:flagellar basal body-associated protein FliL
MRKNRRFQMIALVAAVGIFSASVSCGYFLYPKRRGNKGGGLHTPTLVMDLLWLLPGIIPGVVALAVDFSTGAIYLGKGGKAQLQNVDRKTKIVVVKPKVKHRTELTVNLYDQKGKVVYTNTSTLRPRDRDPGSLTIPLERFVRATRAGIKSTMRFQVLMDGNVWTEVPLSVR